MEFIKGSKNLRKGRVSIAGQYYLITTVTINKTEVFKEKRAADIVLNSLYWLDHQNRIDLQAAVVMPDHLYFIARLNKGTLSGLMHSLKSYTSKQIKAKLNHTGTIWQTQYHDHAIRKDEELKEMMIYCLQNPVRANMVNDFHDYPYWYCKFNV
ncbi:MAG: transposase [Desulfobacterium sp.]|nr:transposase [Desulfobacterium sp.]